MNRSRCLLGPLALVALLVVAACSSSPRPGAGLAERSSQADPAAGRATSPAAASPPTHPGRIRLRGRVAFASDHQGNVDIQTLDLPGGRLHRLTTSPAADLSPTWAPDGRRLAFRSDRDSNDEIYAMNADGSGQHNLTRDPASDYSPAWSPDGRQIAFATSRADPTGSDVWLMRTDGSHPRPLVRQQGIDEYPVWSADGARLAFSCTLGAILASRVGDFEICVVNADGTGLRRIADAPGVSAAGGWSQEGTRIVFASSREQDPEGVSPCGDLFTVDAEGSRLAKLTDGPARDCGPSWSPDGRHILFSSDRADPGADSEEQEPALMPCKGACP